MCYLIRCYLAWPHEQGHWLALVRAHYKPSPFLPLFSSPSIPLSVLPMNVSISLPMCKLFSPALRADGEQCLCRDFLCMSFLISQRVTRFPCFLLEKSELARSRTQTLHACTNTITVSNQYAHRVAGILVQWWQWQGSLHELTLLEYDGLIQQRRPRPRLILPSAIPNFSSNWRIIWTGRINPHKHDNIQQRCQSNVTHKRDWRGNKHLLMP